MAENLMHGGKQLLRNVTKSPLLQPDVYKERLGGIRDGVQGGI